jgi:hypothetical protein
MRPAAKIASIGAGFATAAAALFSAAAGAVLLSACGSCDSIVHQTAQPILAAGNFDAVVADQAGHQIFFADQATHGVDVVDISTGSPQFAGVIDVGGATKGLAYAPDRHRLYAGIESGYVAVVDTDPASGHYMHMIDQVTVDPTQADLLDYSAKTHTVYVGPVIATRSSPSTPTRTRSPVDTMPSPRWSSRALMGPTATFM